MKNIFSHESLKLINKRKVSNLQLRISLAVARRSRGVRLLVENDRLNFNYILTADVFAEIERPKEIKYSTWPRVEVKTIDVYLAST